MQGDGTREPADEAASGDIQDAVPPEWIRAVEWEAAVRRARRTRRLAVASWLVPTIAVVVFAISFGAVVESSHTPPPAPAVTPSAVLAFANSLRGSQEPDASGVTVVDSTEAPNTWRVAWQTPDAAFCFAFVHESEPPQTVCDPAGSAQSGWIRIGGELSDTSLGTTELFACGYVKNSTGYVDVDDDAVIGTLTPMAGSELDAFCVQLPDGTAPGASFTLASQAITAQSGKNETVADVTATYP